MFKKKESKQTIDICMFCGKALQDHSEIDLDSKKFQYNIPSQEPCNHCKAEMDTAEDEVVLLGMKNKPTFGKAQEPIQISKTGNKLYLTGNFLVMPKEAVKEILNIEANPGQNMILVGIELIEIIVEQYKVAKKEVFGEE